MRVGFTTLRGSLWLLALLLVLPLLLAACAGGDKAPVETVGPTVEPSPTPVTEFAGEAVVYVVAPLSGPEAQRGQALAAGARLAAEELNQIGGVLGRKIVIKVANDRGDSEGALQAARRVADSSRARDTVIGVLVHEGSDPQLESVKQVYLDPGSGLNALVVVPASAELVPADIDDPRFVRLSAPSISQASEVATVLQEANLRDVVVVHSSTPAGKILAKEFSRAAENLDVEAVGTFEILPPDASDYTDLVAKVRKINPAALFFAAGQDEAACSYPTCSDSSSRAQCMALTRPCPMP